MRNDLTIYDAVADHWWADQPRWVQTLQNMVPARLAWLENFVRWQDLDVLDLEAAGGFIVEELHDLGAGVTGIDPAKGAIAAAKLHAEKTRRSIRYDVGVGEDLPYPQGSFDALVCVDVLEHVENLPKVLAEDVLGMLPKGTHDPNMFIRPEEMRKELSAQGLSPGPMTGLCPAWISRGGQIKFSRLPTTAIIYMGTARKPEWH